MTVELIERPRSRRALRAGVLGGVGAWAATAVGRAGPVHAEGQPILVGGEYLDATGATSVTVTPDVDVTSSSFVLLTAKANIGKRSVWFTTDTTNDRFTIRISSARAKPTLVAWLLLG